MAAAETERKTLQLQMLDLESEVIFEFEELEAELLHLRSATEEMGRQLKESEQKRCAPCHPWAAGQPKGTSSRRSAPLLLSPSAIQASPLTAYAAVTAGQQSRNFGKAWSCSYCRCQTSC